ncbi:RsmD family RNA methyltransferase [Campylobacter sp. RM16188]|uniref:RsmD family RNA methyltransferase n=1 Tax=Campylobacter sp. RM16188 TaxID=1705725 RepID=UPI0015556D02|nr:RsmD family RNA methyltransferase [Campylobacter sp. RM16188]
MKRLFTTISSGKFKGKKLALPSLATTRSTKNIVKGSFFDSFRYDLRGKIFIEAFCGSALMACEALSNEAKKAYAIELDKAAFKIACENAKSIDELNLRVLNGDTFKLTPEILKSENFGEKSVILYLDPPFDIRDGFKEIYEKCLNLISNLDEKQIFLIAIEHASSYTLPENIGKFTLVKNKKFGNTSLSYYS